MYHAAHRSKLLSRLLDSAMADTVAGAVDCRGRPASRAATGGWKASVFVMTDGARRRVHRRVEGRLPNAAAAARVRRRTTWLGRYRAIILASVIFVLSMGTLSMSSALPIFRSGHVAVFYVALYLVALGEGAHKPCAQAFAADQFDEKDPKECVARSSFFNWCPASSKGEGDAGDLVEEVKSVFRLLPIWASCIIYAIIFSQTSTFFTKQAATLDRRIGRSFQVPPAALQTFISVSIVVFIPVYDRLFVPLARRYNGQVPDAVRSLGLALFLSIFGVGHLLSSLLISVIDRTTAKRGGSWFSNNLNRAHLDYFYWLLAGLCVVELVAFLFFSRVYAYKRKPGDAQVNGDYDDNFV
ncbi:hypothetical protein GUJ93_ZPchr0643g7039 [Zizania palustris]|uniref:Uncharacterized protein n=1 Tax=Zizania palustris TaxID=103762 RepID=A0A8J5QR35_ZIZPA|nr:hypothetical protein GUJ93_ZPchr0643g7039 [Zizania palustris]